jgi:diaminohydroxyphosphoribosylaminopyrimidine deaminase/5-amino-6-(5-phosphoribosylamino)uracil reductase
MTDQDYMRRAIQLAKLGAGWTSPNPMVGAVIVKDDRIIGEGYHQKCGELHAERNALASLTEAANGATMYVTLEPCCHYGRTPPCTEAILSHGIARVVIGSRDPNPLVSGKGARILRENGVLVDQDVLREECDAVNPAFFHYITTGRPYVVMKYAMTLDGKIAAHTGASKWITGPEARAHVHQLRSQYSVIMAGIGTVLADDPMLNCRLEHTGFAANQLPPHQPLRVIVDSQLRIPTDSKICQSAHDYPTIVACAQPDTKKVKQLEALGVRVHAFPSGTDAAGRVDLRALIEWLGQNKYDSVLIEGGGTLHEAALQSGIVNHVSAYIAPKLLGGRDAKTPVEGIGADTPALGAQLMNLQITKLGDDLLLDYDIAGGMNHVYWNC